MRISGLSTRHLLTFSSGAGATLAMMAVSRAAASPVMPELQELAATAVSDRGSTVGAALGFAAQLVNGGLFAQVYDAAFDRLSLQPGLVTGAGIGLVHGTLAGMALGAVPAVHPRVPEQQPDPGAFLHRLGGSAAATLLALHVLYGALVGAALAAIRHEEGRAADEAQTA
jgi:hypothetical protein